MQKRDVSVLLIVILAAGIFAVTMYFGVVTLFDKTWFSPDEGGGDPTIVGEGPPVFCEATVPSIKLLPKDEYLYDTTSITDTAVQLLALVPEEKFTTAYNFVT